MPNHVSRLFYYPVKGCRRVETETLPITEVGAAGDREYMLIQPDGTMLSQRNEPAMALIDPEEVIAACQATGHIVPVSVHRWHGYGEDQGDVVARQVSDVLQNSVRVVRFPRQLARCSAAGGGTVAYQDASPVTVVSQTSLDEVCRWLQVEIPVERFRPNILIAGLDVPFEEDDILTISTPQVHLEIVQLRGRCAVTTVDQDTGERGKEPLRELSKRRVLPQLGGGQQAMFAVDTVPRRLGTIRVGDEVQATYADEPYTERVTTGDFRG